MGFFDALLGGRRKLQGVAPDRLFAMTTAYVGMEIEHGMKTSGSAGIVFQPLATSDFQQILTDAEELLKGTAAEEVLAEFLRERLPASLGVTAGQVVHCLVLEG